MQPVLTVSEMNAVDAAALASTPLDVLVGRAGMATALAAVDLLGGTYGCRVAVIAGRGNNGADGRHAARLLSARGARVRIVEAGTADAIGTADLVIDAAYGTGFRGTYTWPAIAEGTAVLAVDIPSGVDGNTGEADPGVHAATTTVTFAALKPGLVFEPGAGLAGQVVVSDIGLDVSGARAGLVEADDVREWLPERAATTNKWRSAVWLVAGSPGMYGSAALAAAGAQRAGAGYVRQSSPGSLGGPALPTVVVQVVIPSTGWSASVLADLGRFGALVAGNGLGTDSATASEIRALVSAAEGSVVVDADGLTALGADAASVVGSNAVLTPHDGEFARLAGGPPGPDRLVAARDLAVRLGCVVLLKGGPTVVADSSGRVAVVASGDARLASAGTGDVLAGIIGALCAQGLDGFRAAAAAAFLHGEAAALGWRHGLVAGDLPANLPRVLERLTARPPGRS
jgi:ADP-dependent NAD(P)H-hydrate dehydratase / NAD(P)H-hydrate epimerase